MRRNTYGLDSCTVICHHCGKVCELDEDDFDAIWKVGDATDVECPHPGCGRPFRVYCYDVVYGLPGMRNEEV